MKNSRHCCVQRTSSTWTKPVHKDNGDHFWAWCFRASDYAVFKVSASRGSEVLLDVLGRQFEGTLGCDFFSAYRKYVKDCGIHVQFCLAHFIRDVKFLTTLSDVATVAYGQRLLRDVGMLFHLASSTRPSRTRRVHEPVGECARFHHGRRATRRTQHPRCPKDRPATAPAWQCLFRVHHHARTRTDEQPRRTSHSFRDYRSPHHPRHPRPKRLPVERTHLDRDGHPAHSRGAPPSTISSMSFKPTSTDCRFPLSCSPPRNPVNGYLFQCRQRVLNRLSRDFAFRLG